jgi:hypothetical protein
VLPGLATSQSTGSTPDDWLALIGLFVLAYVPTGSAFALVAPTGQRAGQMTLAATGVSVAASEAVWMALGRPELWLLIFPAIAGSWLGARCAQAGLARLRD